MDEETETFEEYKENEKKVTEDVTENAAEKTTNEKKSLSAKTTSLITQGLAAVWIAVWNALQFVQMIKGQQYIAVTDIILSGLSIAACFSPVYFSIIMDKIKSIRFGGSD